MEKIKKYKKVIFYNVSEDRFFLTYARIFHLKTYQMERSVNSIKEMWETTPVDILHEMSTDILGNFTHTTTSKRKITFLKGINSSNMVILDFSENPSIEFACQWVHELKPACQSIFVEYE